VSFQYSVKDVLGGRVGSQEYTRSLVLTLITKKAALSS